MSVKCWFYDFFCWRYALINWPCYNNLFQIMQHDNFRNLNGVIFTQWKLKSRIHGFWYCFKVIKQYRFHYFMKLVPIPGKQSSFEILRLFNTWRYQSLVIFFSSVVTLIYKESDGVKHIHLRTAFWILSSRIYFDWVKVISVNVGMLFIKC